MVSPGDIALTTFFAEASEGILRVELCCVSM